MTDGRDNYVSAGWEAWISLYVFYCACFSIMSILETRNFISPSSLIVLLCAVIEPQHETLIKKAKAEAAVSTDRRLLAG